MSRTQAGLLLLAAGVNMVTIAGYLPLLLNAGLLGLLGWRACQIWRDMRIPSRAVLLSLLGLAALIVVFSARGPLGVENGAMLLPVMVALKLLETRSRRDAFVSVSLICLLILITFFFTQTILTAAVAALGMVIAMGVLISLNHETGTTWGHVRLAGVLMAQALPFMVVLFVLFPRNLMPLWTLPPSASRAETGLKDWMSPGSISELSLSAETVFRVRFSRETPPTTQLYWRGPVLTEFDGRTWRSAPSRPAAMPTLEGSKSMVDYELTLEPHNNVWLLALDMPVSLPKEGFFTQNYQLISQVPVRTRIRYNAQSVLFPDADADLPKDRLTAFLQLPEGDNPQARDLAKKLRTENDKDAALVKEALTYFSHRGFTYTLKPPTLGTHPVDDFMFRTREGFCEHFASAFVFLMRAAGIPSRVVTGYQGGELNPIDNYVVVRQADAHAWAEVWIEGSGWQRVDPTASAAPMRVMAGLATALPEAEGLPLAIRRDIPWLRAVRFRLDAITNGWNQWVLGYNTQSQQQLLMRFGMRSADWRNLAVASTALVAIFMTALALWAAWPQQRIGRAQQAWRQLTKKLARRGIRHEAWEGPLDYAERVGNARADLRKDIHRIAELYAQLRYGRKPAANDLRQLKKLIRKFAP